MLLLLMLHEALEFRQLVVIVIKANAAAAAIITMEWIIMEIAHVNGESVRILIYRPTGAAVYLRVSLTIR